MPRAIPDNPAISRAERGDGDVYYGSETSDF